MNSIGIVEKRSKRTEEVKTRSRKLPHRSRTRLIMIDGGMTAGQFQAAGVKLGATANFLDSLEQHGLVAARAMPVPLAAAAGPAIVQAAAEGGEAERFRAAQKFMNDTVADALGFRAFFFTLNLEKYFTRADLAGLLDDYAKGLAKGGDADVTAVLVARAREMLA